MRLVVFSAQSSVYGAIRYVDIDNPYLILVIDTFMQWLSMSTYHL